MSKIFFLSHILQNSTYKSSNNQKIIQNTIELMVPIASELNEKLYENHYIYFHCNHKDVQDLFKINNIGFYGLNNYIEDYVCNCHACVQSSKHP